MNSCQILVVLSLITFNCWVCGLSNLARSTKHIADALSQPKKIHNVPLKHEWIFVGDVSIHCVEAGTPKNGSNVVLLLHGFPDIWLTWKHQIPIFASEGYYVVAPDLRGYGSSDKPIGVENYRAHHLAADIDTLRRHYCPNGFKLIVGHDWGAAVVWNVLQRIPSITERAVILNVPHPSVFRKGLFTPFQLLKSVYIFFFQLPFLPEALLGSSWARRALVSSLTHHVGIYLFEVRSFSRPSYPFP